MEDVKITDASYFPNPQKIWKEIPISVSLGEGAKDYIKAWRYNGMLVMASVGIYDDKKEWLHVSVSRRSRIPTYEEMCMVKRDFFGDDKKVISVLPEREYHVNLAQNCLHLFYSKDNPLPEFSNKKGLI